MSDDLNLSLLDKSIDDIEDLAGFAVPPNGMYSLKFSTKLKEVNGKPSVEANFEVISTVELNDADTASDPATKPGTKFSTLYQYENPIALSRLKELTAPVAAHFGETNLLVLVRDICQDLIVVARVRRRADKVDKDKFYADVSGIMLE